MGSGQRVESHNPSCALLSQAMWFLKVPVSPEHQPWIRFWAVACGTEVGTSSFLAQESVGLGGSFLGAWVDDGEGLSIVLLLMGVAALVTLQGIETGTVVDIDDDVSVAETLDAGPVVEDGTLAAPFPVAARKVAQLFPPQETP